MDCQFTIFSIEDDEFISLFLRDMILIHGKEFNACLDAVRTGEEAQNYLKEKVPNIIMLDLSFPEKKGEKAVPESGFKLLQQLNNDKRFKDTKIIVFSGYSDDELKDKAKELGADYYMIKGEYLPKDLLKILKDIHDGKEVAAVV